MDRMKQLVDLAHKLDVTACNDSDLLVDATELMRSHLDVQTWLLHSTGDGLWVHRESGTGPMPLSKALLSIARAYQHAPDTTGVADGDAAREEAAQLRQQLAAEASAPIVWDGSEEAYDEVCAALEHSESNLRVHIDGPDYAEWLDIEDGSTLTTVGRVVPNARIRADGDSFVILPPEVPS